MPNTNCLEGMRCPKCGQERHFKIVGRCFFEVTDNGSEAIGDHDWDGGSFIVCPECDHDGTVRDFIIDNQSTVMIKDTIQADVTTAVEITPEMIEAGKEVIESKWIEFTGMQGFLLWDEVLSATFRAMMEARPL